MSTSARPTGLLTYIADIRSFLWGGYQTLPLTIAGALFILGTMTANWAALFFLIGYLIVVPLLVSLTNMAGEAILPESVVSSFRVNANDLCGLVTGAGAGAGTADVVIFDKWLAMIAFLVGYLLTNAIELYKAAPKLAPNATTEEKAAAEAAAAPRKSRAILSMFTIVIVAVVILALRLIKTGGCVADGAAGVVSVLATLGVFASLGGSWFLMIGGTNQNMLSDLFGIANRLLTPAAMESSPVACLPSA